MFLGRLDSKNLVKNFINEEGDRLQSLIRESYQGKKTKEYRCSQETYLFSNATDNNLQIRMDSSDHSKHLLP